MRDVTLPPSPDELRRARKRSTIAHAVGAVGLTVIVVLWLAAGSTNIWVYIFFGLGAVSQWVWLAWDLNQMRRSDRVRPWEGDRNDSASPGTRSAR